MNALSYLRHLWRCWQLAPVPTQSGRPFWFVRVAARLQTGEIVPTGEQSILWTDHQALMDELTRTRPGLRLIDTHDGVESYQWVDRGITRYYTVEGYR